MKKNYLLLFLILSLSLHAYASESEERKLGAFNELTVEDGITVILTHSDKNKVTVAADGIALSDVITDLSVFSLRVKLNNYNVNASVTVEIFYTDKLDVVTTVSGVHVLSSGILYADKLSINARFGGVVRFEIAAKEVEIQASGATVTITGNTAKLNVYALKDAFVDCSSLIYTTKKVSASGNGIVKLKE